MKLHKTIATVFGIGYISKGSGTVAAFALCVLVYIANELNVYSNVLSCVFSVIVFAAGVHAANEVEIIWGKDSKKVVIDEVFGMMITLLFLPINFTTLIGGFILFRFFDIAKPLYIRKMENYKGGWGVMMDDFLAGVYANILLQVIIRIQEVI